MLLLKENKFKMSIPKYLFSIFKLIFDSISFLEFYVGYRFDAPKKWIAKADEISRKFGID